MRIRLVAVGKLKEAAWRDAAADYQRRIGRFAALEVVELKDEEPARLTASLMQRALPRGQKVALEVDGLVWTSEHLAKYLSRIEGSGVPELTLFIGGSYGLPQAFSKSLDVRLSLSAMTLPHRLARVFLLEQLYRGFTILRGEPYSH